MRKIFVSILGMFLILGLFAACGGNNDGEEETVVDETVETDEVGPVLDLLPEDVTPIPGDEISEPGEQPDETTIENVENELSTEPTEPLTIDDVYTKDGLVAMYTDDYFMCLDQVYADLELTESNGAVNIPGDKFEEYETREKVCEDEHVEWITEAEWREMMNAPS